MSSVPLQNFHLFPLLPTEIRLQIWQLVPEARVVQLRHRGRCDSSGFVSDSAEPSILHVCRESREVGLSIYSLAFRRRTAFTPRVFPATVYFNYALDTVYFCKQKCCDPLWLLHDVDVLRKLRKIAIPQGIFHSVSRFRSFLSLEEIVLVFEDPRFHIRGDVKLDKFPPLEPRRRYDYSQHQETFHKRLLASLQREESRKKHHRLPYTPPKVSIKALVGFTGERPRVKPNDGELLVARDKQRKKRRRYRKRPRKVVGSGAARQPKQVSAGAVKESKQEVRPVRHPATAPYNLRSISRRK